MPVPRIKSSKIQLFGRGEGKKPASLQNTRIHDALQLTDLILAHKTEC